MKINILEAAYNNWTDLIVVRNMRNDFKKHQFPWKK
jgi:hypothetical protein